MPKTTEETPDCTLFLLGKAYQKAHGDFKKQLLSFGLTNMQHLVLEGLWYKPGVTAAELGKTLVLDKATLSGVLDRMKAGSWIVKKQDQDDRRIHRLYPSEKANSIKSELIAARVKSNKELLKNFTHEEEVLFKRMLRDLM